MRVRLIRRPLRLRRNPLSLPSARRCSRSFASTASRRGNAGHHRMLVSACNSRVARLNPDHYRPLLVRSLRPLSPLKYCVSVAVPFTTSTFSLGPACILLRRARSSSSWKTTFCVEAPFITSTEFCVYSGRYAARFASLRPLNASCASTLDDVSGFCAWTFARALGVPESFAALGCPVCDALMMAWPAQRTPSSRQEPTEDSNS